MSLETAVRVQVHRPLPPEEQARADFYALFARLLNAAPDARLLATVAVAGEIPDDGEPALAKAWREFVAAASVMDSDAAVDEYQALFQGIGAAEVSIYSAFYVGASSVDHPRVKLQADLARFQLAKRDAVTEPDDHWAGLFDVMRVLVAGGAGRGPGTLAEQRQFYQAHLEPGLGKFFRAMQEAASANFYRKVAALGLAFTAIESESYRLV